MKKNLTCLSIFFILLGVLLAGTTTIGQAQAPDTVVVEPGTPGAVEQAILANPGKVIKLRRNGVYIVQETITSDTGIVIYGEPSPTSDPPATLVRSADTGGPSVIDTNNDLKLENVAILGWTLQGNGINVVMRLRNKDGGDYEFYNCYFERTTNRFTRWDAPNPRVIAMDNIFLNVGNINAWQNGFCFQFQNAMPREAIIQNNTILNAGSVFITNFQVELNGNFTIDHNTFVLGNREYFAPNDNYVNVMIKNNIFLNPFSRGYCGVRVNANGDTTYFGDFVDAETDDPGDSLQAFLTFDSLAVELLPELGITEDERNVTFTHNCLYREQRIYDWYAACCYTEQPFMTERSRTFVENNPSITIDEPINIDPEFVKQLPDSVYDNYMKWIEYNRFAEAFKPPGPTPDRYWYTDGNSDLPFAWPIRPSDGPDALLDLSYSTSSPLYTAGTDGFPLGDLNWFQDKKQEWITGVENKVSNVPQEFQMLQNYPNPFNPTTTISYTLAKPAEVTLTISNLLGQQVRVLVNKKQVSGNYKVVWDGKDDLGKDVTSGVYFYSLKYGKEMTTRKMALIR